MEIKYRNGLPTKASMQSLIDQYFKDLNYKVRMSYGFGRKKYGNACLLFSDERINKQIDEFAGYLQEQGIVVGELRLYESPMVGFLEIKMINPIQ